MLTHKFFDCIYETEDKEKYHKLFRIKIDQLDKKYQDPNLNEYNIMLDTTIECKEDDSLRCIIITKPDIVAFFENHLEKQKNSKIKMKSCIIKNDVPNYNCVMIDGKPYIKTK